MTSSSRHNIILEGTLHHNMPSGAYLNMGQLLLTTPTALSHPHNHWSHLFLEWPTIQFYHWNPTTEGSTTLPSSKQRNTALFTTLQVHPSSQVTTFDGVISFSTNAIIAPMFSAL